MPIWIIRRFLYLIAALCVLPADGRAAEVPAPPGMPLIDLKREIVRTQEERIQKRILDRLLGEDRASAVLDMDFDLRQKSLDNNRTGAGSAEKYKAKGAKNAAAAAPEILLPGIYRPKNVLDPTRPRPEQQTGQTAAQIKTESEKLYTENLVVSTASVKVFHSVDIPDPKQKAIRAQIVETLTPFKDAKGLPAVLEGDVRFIRQDAYSAPAKIWIDQLKDPDVFIPLLYAILLLLLLMFLFGPFASFLRRYTQALTEKPAAEVNVESNIEPPEEEGGEGGGGGGGGPEESVLDILVGRKPPEQPPPPPDDEEDEEDGMPKGEPFSYINEENLRRLANLFLLRREEPWLIAVVLSYLSPEYARQVLTALPVDLQAKVAMEALKVRQVTREQIQAIDEDIRENVDFVVGGIDRLTRMLEEADNQTRNNILEYLKNEKPVVYEHVRKSVLLFEDIASFPDREMQIIVRALKAEDMSKALQKAPPEVVNKFFNNMSANAASLLKEQMEYAHDMSPAQIEEERAKIMEQIKSMDKEGKISLREGGTETESGFEEVLATDDALKARIGGIEKKHAEEAKSAEESGGSPGDKDGARRYLDAGVQLHEEGNLEDAVKYFQQAVEMDPDLWEAYQYLGTDLYQLGRAAEALEYFEKLLALRPDPQVAEWVESCRAQLQQG